MHVIIETYVFVLVMHVIIETYVFVLVMRVMKCIYEVVYKVSKTKSSEFLLEINNIRPPSH